MSVIQLTIGGNTKRSKLGQRTVEIDFDALPEKSRAFVVAYGLRQYLADGMAGATTEADANEGVAERRRKLLEADFQRTRGESEGKSDSVETRALKLARAYLREQMKAANITADKEKVAEAAKVLVERDPQWKIKAKEQLDFEARTTAELANNEAADLLGLLGMAEPEADGSDEEPEGEGDQADAA